MKVEVSTKDLDQYLKIRALHDDAIKRNEEVEAAACLKGMKRILKRYPDMDADEFERLVTRYEKQRRSTPGHAVDWRAVARAVLAEVLKGWKAAAAEADAEAAGENDEDDEDDAPPFEFEVRVSTVKDNVRVTLEIEDLIDAQLPLDEDTQDALLEHVTAAVEEALLQWLEQDD